jgi:hypothetical protein
MVWQSGFENTKRKMSKMKVMVRNPFERKLSKSPQNELFNQSQIIKNDSRISKCGEMEIANIISLI